MARWIRERAHVLSLLGSPRHRSGINSRLLASCLLVASAHGPSALRAQALVTTVVDPCVPVERESLDRLLQIELGTSAQTAASSKGPAHVHVRCVEAGIELHLQDALTRKDMVRVLSRESFRDTSSTRMLALAIAELVVASWVELQLPQRVQPAGPAPSPEVRKAAVKRIERRVRFAPASEKAHTVVGLTAALQMWSEQTAVAPAIGIHLAHAPLPELAFALGADVSAVTVGSAIGTVQAQTASASIAVLGRLEAPSLVLVTGPGARMGLAQVSGTPDDPEQTEVSAFYAPIGGVLWLTRASWVMAPPFALVLAAELGVVTLPVRALADEVPTVVFGGAFFELGMGLELAL